MGNTFHEQFYMSVLETFFASNMYFSCPELSPRMGFQGAGRMGLNKPREQGAWDLNSKGAGGMEAEFKEH